MGGSLPYVYRDGKRLAPGVANAFEAMDAAFRAQFPGVHLIVSDGVRTWQEQYDLWREYLRGGVLALHPDNSLAYHVETNPRGQRAVDLRDSGADAGVLTPGTERANWLYANAPRFGFDPAGYGFSYQEPWHYEYQGNPWDAPAAPLEEPSDFVKHRGQGAKMETVVKAPNGTIAHIAPGAKYNFGSADEYNTARDQINTLRRFGGSNIMPLPAITEVRPVGWDTFEFLCKYAGVEAS